jgi:hypothetical protein
MSDGNGVEPSLLIVNGPWRLGGTTKEKTAALK